MVGASRCIGEIVENDTVLKAQLVRARLGVFRSDIKTIIAYRTRRKHHRRKTMIEDGIRDKQRCIEQQGQERLRVANEKEREGLISDVCCYPAYLNHLVVVLPACTYPHAHSHAHAHSHRY
jgi:hypothetical protein